MMLVERHFRNLQKMVIKGERNMQVTTTVVFNTGDILAEKVSPS